jgi:TAT-translocated FGD2 family F420-dependent dehydrogenase
MRAPLRAGFVLSHEQFPPPALVANGCAAEEAGFDGVWTSDHFHPWQDNEGHSGQAWLTLSALGQRTRSVTMGTAVTCPTYRYNPAIVAQAFATLGLLYPGRVFLGVGSGEALNEVPAGGGFGDFEERASRLAEAVGLIRELWTGQWVTHHGRFYSVDQAHIYDLPTQPVPLYLAGSGRKSARLAGECGDGWITDAQSGRDSARMRVLVEHFVVVGGKADAEEAARLWRFIPIGFSQLLKVPDPREIQRQAEQQLSLEDVYRNWVVGDDPEQHAEALERLRDAGATDVYIHSGQRDQRRVIDFYGNHVLPRLRRQRQAA